MNTEWVEGFKELRMVMAIGQQPAVLMCVDGKPVGPCVNVSTNLVRGADVEVHAEYETTRDMTASGAIVRLPSGWELAVAFPDAVIVRAFDRVNIRGTVHMGET